MSKGEKYNSNYKPTWCPGCGNFAIWTSLKEALDELKIEKHKTAFFHGIGCSGNMANTLDGYGWHSLHGRAVPSALGAKLVNKDLTVIASGGDGDGYGEGMGHLIHAIRGNVDVTYVVHDNQIYGLTTGQNSPTSEKGSFSKSNPFGVIDQAFNPMATALSAGCGFVARGFSGNGPQLREIFKAAIKHKGFSFIDVLQPCVTFNRLNTYRYFYDRVYDLQAEKHDTSSIEESFKRALEWGDKIPTGIFYQSNERKNYAAELPQTKGQKFIAKEGAARNISSLMKNFM